MGSAESSGRNGNNNSAGAVAGVAAAAAAVYGVCSFLASINNKEEGPMMKAPGQKGVYIKRKDFENNPRDYFKGNRGK